MTRRALPAAALLGLALTAGCPSDAPNPPRLWLYLDGSETNVKLIPYEPEPF
jgi:hypothetical protein